MTRDTYLLPIFSLTDHKYLTTGIVNIIATLRCVQTYDVTLLSVYIRKVLQTNATGTARQLDAYISSVDLTLIESEP